MICSRVGVILLVASLAGCASGPPPQGAAAPDDRDTSLAGIEREPIPEALDHPVPVDTAERRRVAAEAHHEFQVERLATIIRIPQAAYPEGQGRAGVRGKVFMTFVVDTLGVVEAASIRQLGESHPSLALPSFTASARAAILAARFQPAEVGGRKVRAWVRHDVEFLPPR